MFNATRQIFGSKWMAVKNNGGFTLVELMVAISLMFILFWFSLHLLSFVQTKYNSWNEQRVLERSVRRMDHTLRFDLNHTGLKFIADSIILDLRTMPTQGTKLYRLANEMVYRGNLSLIHPPVQLKTFSVQLKFFNPRTDSLIAYQIPLKKPFVIPEDSTDFILRSVVFNYQYQLHQKELSGRVRFAIRPNTLYAYTLPRIIGKTG